VEGTLPPKILELWDLKEAAQRISPNERIEELRNIAMSCDELDSHCEGAACRHFGRLEKLVQERIVVHVTAGGFVSFLVFVEGV